MMKTAVDMLALLGGPKAVADAHDEIFKWPIVTSEDEEAVLDVLRRGAMSGTEITKQFEREYADWMGTKYGLAYCNGTAALRAAMWACGVGAGDEVICPSMTYWASCTSALSLGAAVNFADIEADTLCIDAADIEHRIGPRTKAIIAVHFSGYPCDMDSIMAIARKHGVKVIEDVSHAHGGLYKGRKVGTIGDVAAMSMMSGKGFAAGEAGMLVTDNREIFERCVAYGHYERTGGPSRFNTPECLISEPSLTPFAGVPLGGAKHRMNQTCSAMGRVQLKYFPSRMAEIHRAMNRFWDLLDGLPGLRAHCPPKDSNSTMGGWFAAHGLYRGEELGGLSCARFCEALRAEGVSIASPGADFPLHLHPVFNTADIFNMGQPTMISFGQRDVRQGPGSLPVSESIDEITMRIPWFKHDDAEVIETYANAYRKVVVQAEKLM